LPIKNWFRERVLVKVTLPRHALVFAVFDNHALLHTAAVAAQVFLLTLFSVDSPSATAPTANGFVFMHVPTLSSLQVLPLACSDEVLIQEISKVEHTEAEMLRQFLRDSIPGTLNAAVRSNETTASDSLMASRGPRYWASLYPNPAKEMLQIQCAAKPTGILVTDVQGKMQFVSVSALEQTQEEGYFFTADIHSLSPGVYQISLRTDLGIVSQTVIKQ
jgi:hypothetical protein